MANAATPIMAATLEFRIVGQHLDTDMTDLSVIDGCCRLRGPSRPAKPRTATSAPRPSPRRRSMIQIRLSRVDLVHGNGLGARCRVAVAFGGCWIVTSVDSFRPAGCLCLSQSWGSAFANDASEPDMARGRIDRLGVTRGRPIAAAVAGRAQVRAA